VNTRTIARAGVIAALYAVVTYVVAPLSWGPLQFRASELLKGVTLLLGWPAIWGFTLGNFLSNIGSPYVGPHELVLMPCINFVGSWLAWRLRGYPALGLSVYALLIAGGVATVLTYNLGAPWLVIAASVAISELALIVGGWFIIWRRPDIADALEAAQP